MNRAVFHIFGILVVALISAAYAQDKPAPDAKPSPEAERRALQNLSPEERDRIREQWQNMSEEDRAKFRETLRQRAAGTGGGAQVLDRKELAAAQIARLKEQHQATIGELQAVKELALKENAKQTAEALTRLIAKHQQQFDQQMQAVERRLNAASGEPDAKPATPRQGDTDKQKAQREDARTRRAERAKQAR